MALEGYYDELVRFMYAVEQLLATGTVQDPDLLKYASVDSMEDSMPAPPEAIFEIWESGRSIRNAIAHARFYYSAKDETFRFVVIDWKKRRVKFDKRITVAEVRRLYEKIGVVGAALRVLLLLLVIYSLLVIPADRILGIPQRALRFRTSSCTV